MDQCLVVSNNSNDASNKRSAHRLGLRVFMDVDHYGRVLNWFEELKARVPTP